MSNTIDDKRVEDDSLHSSTGELENISQPEYIYVTIPIEYVCVYHRVLAMMADYGEEMLKDCKANCTDRNSNVIECFNMFNSAVAARKLGKHKLADTIIKYIKAKINQIYKGFNNATSSIFPVDENGELKAFVTCDDNKFTVNPQTGNLYQLNSDSYTNDTYYIENGHLINKKEII